MTAAAIGRVTVSVVHVTRMSRIPTIDDLGVTGVAAHGVAGVINRRVTTAAA